MVLGAGVHSQFHLRPLGYDRRKQIQQEGNSLLVLPAFQLAYRFQLMDRKLIQLSFQQSLGGEEFLGQRVNRSASVVSVAAYLN